MQQDSEAIDELVQKRAKRRTGVAELEAVSERIAPPLKQWNEA
jgi:hypothetical protein